MSTPEDSHLILELPPAFWNSKELLAIAMDSAQNLSPMQLYDVLHMPLPKLQFFILSLSQMFQPEQLCELLFYVVDLVQCSFEGMDLTDVKKNLQTIVGYSQLLSSFAPDKQVENKTESDLNLDIAVALSYCHDEFDSLWMDLFPEYSKGSNSWAWNEFNKETMKNITYNDPVKYKESFGYDTDDLNRLMKLREDRDLKWLNSESAEAKSTEKLVTGFLTYSPAEDHIHYFRSIWNMFLGQDDACTGIVSHLCHGGHKQKVLSYSRWFFHEQTGEFAAFAYLFHPVVDDS
jgi:hypothetical protein